LSEEGEKGPRGAPRLLGPDGKEIRKDQPLLVDAFGRSVHAAPEDQPPERPRLRALELIAAQDRDREVLIARDPMGVTENPVVFRVEMLPLLQMLDGQTTTEELAQRAVSETGDMRHADSIRRFVEDLDRLYLLESPRFERRRAELATAYRAETVREPALAGVSYPEDPEELRRFLGGHLAEARAILSAEGAPKPPAEVRALSVPHLDLQRAGVAIGVGFAAMPESPPPDLVILFGTGHMLYEQVVALTDKTMRTPLGELECDREAVARVAERVGPAAYEDETAFRHEHSIEFPVLYLQYRYGPQPKLLPVLCGGFHRLLAEGRRPTEDSALAATLLAVREEAERATAAGKRVLYLAAVDLSHVGARFGDREPLDQEMLDAIRQIDEAALSAAAPGNADAWFDMIASHGDSTRVCGFSAQYALLAAARPGPGTLLRYEQSLEEGGSVVTCATMAWPGAAASALASALANP
jgi:MEMO1 family protein